MKHFANSMKKIASEGMVARPSSAQIFAAKRAEQQYLNEIKRDTPAGYAKAVAGAIAVPLLTPALFSLPSVTKDNVLRHQSAVYITEALKNRFAFSADEAPGIAAAIVNSGYDNPITGMVHGRLINVKHDLADAIARDAAPGVDKDVGKRILKESTEVITHLVGGMPPNTPPKDVFALFQSSLAQGGMTIQETLQKYPEFNVNLPKAFNADHAVALRGMGEHLYKQRTGKKLTSNAAAIKLISKAVANSMKAGIPLALIAGGVTLKRHDQSLKTLRQTRAETSRSNLAPKSIWSDI